MKRREREVWRDVAQSRKQKVGVVKISKIGIKRGKVSFQLCGGEEGNGWSTPHYSYCASGVRGRERRGSSEHGGGEIHLSQKEKGERRSFGYFSAQEKGERENQF